MNLTLKTEFLNSYNMIVCSQKYGTKAIGIYISIIALMYENGNINGNANLPLDFHTLSVKFNEDENIVKSVIMDFELFRFTENKGKKEFFSSEVDKFFEDKKQQSERNRENIKKRWDKEKKHHPPTPPVTPTPHVRSDEVAPLPEQPTEKSEEAAEQELPTFACSQENECKDCKKTIHGNRCILNFQEIGTFKKIYQPPPLRKEEAKKIVAEALSSPPLNDYTQMEIKEIEDICFYFYARKCLFNAAEETMRFWNYWAASNWQQKNGKFIVDKVAAAKAWKINEPRIIPKEAVNFAHALLAVAMNTKIPYIQFVSQIYDIEISPGKIILTATPKIIKIIEDNIEPIEMEMGIVYKGKRLEYKVPPQYAEEASKLDLKPIKK